MSLIKKLVYFGLGIALFVGCASPQINERKAKRDKIAESSRMFCDFVNGEVFPDIDVAINLEMAKRCDPDKPMTMTSYRSPSESTGIVYCCSMKAKEDLKQDAAGGHMGMGMGSPGAGTGAKKPTPPATPKPNEKK